MRFIFIFILFFSFINCKDSNSAKPLKADTDKVVPEVIYESPVLEVDNGGLFLPEGFGALVVTDSIGRTGHIAVNDNGDIYAQLRNPENGKGTIALRDIDHEADEPLWYTILYDDMHDVVDTDNPIIRGDHSVVKLVVLAAHNGLLTIFNGL